MSSEAISATSSVSQQASQSSALDTQQSQAAQKLAEAQSLERVQKVQASEEAKKAEEQPSLDDLENAVGKINTIMQESQRSLAFDLDRDSGQVVVKVTNTQTDELIRQIPNEDALKFARNLEGMMGLIFNDKA